MVRPLAAATMCVFALLLLTMTVEAKELKRWQGSSSAAAKPMTIVATDADGWSRIWQLVGQKPPTAFVPAQQAAVAIFLGQRGTGGYGVNIVSMESRQGRFVIVVDETTPGDRIVTQALTTPWLVLLLDRPKEPIEIEPKFRINGSLPGGSRTGAYLLADDIEARRIAIMPRQTAAAAYCAVPCSFPTSISF
jgi:hypothetical protein